MTGQRVMLDMRREIYAHLQRLHVGYFDQNPVGRLMTRVTTDVDAVNELFTSGVVTVFGDLFTLFGIMGVMSGHELAAGPRHLRRHPALLRGDQLVPPRVARRPSARCASWMARINAFLQENLTGMSVVQLFRREERNASRLRRHQPRARRRQPGPDLLLRGLLPRHRAPGRGGHRAHPALRRSARARRATLTLGALVAFIQYSERFWRPISDLSEKFNILQAAMASSERIFTPARHRPLEVRGRRRARPPGEVRGRVGFEGVSFAYDARRARPAVGAAGHRLHGGAGEERGPRRRHRRRQDLDHQPARRASTTCRRAG